MREIRAILQSSTNIYRSINTGMKRLAVSSGIMCASGSSSFSMVSTNSVLNFPEGVSKMIPIGTRESFAVNSIRIFFRIVNADRWLSMVEAVFSQVPPRYPSNARSAKNPIGASS